MQRFQAPDPPEPAAGRPSRPDGAALTRRAALATAGAWVASWAILGLARDATWYVVPLFAGLIGLAARGRLGRAELGFVRGRGHWAAATLAPLLAVAGVVWLAVLTEVARVGDVRPGTLALQVGTMTVLTAAGSLVTEEGFFRGALWATLDRAERSTDAILLWTSGAYVVWYLPFFLFEPGLSAGAVPTAIHALNLGLLALGWGALRLASGSVLVAAWAHGLWSGLAYTLFGYGSARGALAVTDPLRFDPERGWAGVAFNAAVFLWLWRRWRDAERARAATSEAGETDPAA